MIFSLERRFLILLLIPVTLILLLVGVAGFFYARGYLLDQWVGSIQLRLEKAAYQISLQLDEKLELIDLIGKSESVPNGYLMQAFLVQQLVEREGVRFVDIERIEPGKEKVRDEKSRLDKTPWLESENETGEGPVYHGVVR